MEKKPPSLAISYVFTFILFFNIFTINRAMAQKMPIHIKVGVVLDMDSYLGHMGFNCISMALSDFYATYGYSKTRLVLIKRDSKKDVIAAAAAGHHRSTYRSVIPSSATDDQLVAELYKLMTMQTRVFVVHMRSQLGARLFTIAKLEGFGVSSAGTELIRALSSTTFKGLAGNFKLVDGQLQSPLYQIVNIVGPGARGVGYWTKENGIIRELNFHANTSTYSTSKSNIGSIIWPGDKTLPPKGWVVSTRGKKLRIGVPVKQGFSEFLHVAWSPENLTEVEGYCIDVFDAVMKALPYGVPYEYIPFATSDHKSAGSYNDLAFF